MKNKLNNEINQLILSVNFIERKFKQYDLILGNLKDSKENYILARNVYYFNLIMDKIKTNFNEIVIVKKLLKNKKLKKEIKIKLKKSVKDKVIVSTLLLKKLVVLLKNYELDKFDFEVQSNILKENDLLKKVPDKYKNLVVDEFTEIDGIYKNNIENFGLLDSIRRSIRKVKDSYNKVKNFASNLIGQVSSFFKSLFEGLRNVLKLVKRIGSFLFNNLTNFIKLLWKLLIGLFNFVVKWVPKFVSKFISFWKYLYIKTKKTLPITVGTYFLLNVGIKKYWDLLLDGVNVPSQMIEYPALFFTAYIFWTSTPQLRRIQNGIINKILSNLNLMEFIFTNLLGLPKTDIFRKKMSFKKRFIAILNYLKKNFIVFIFRIFIFVLMFKFFGKFSYQELVEDGIPDFRDIILFPVVVIKFILQLII